MVNEGVLDRARAGDGEAFRELTDPYRGELQLHCYRILGSLADAEDLLQETLLAAWRGLDSVASRGTVRAWLYRIATNRCLNWLRAARRRRPPEPVPPFDPPEPTRRSDLTWLQPYPDMLLAEVDPPPGPEERYDSKETVRLAFIAGLQHLPPRQAAVLVLRDVLGYPLAEVATMLEVTTIAAKGALQRARATLDRHRQPAHDEPAPASAQQRDLGHRFAEALTGDDIDGVVALLTDRAWLAMPPAPHEYHGAAAIAAFLRASAAWRGGIRRLHLVPTGANRQPAFGCYIDRSDEETADAAGILVLTPAGDRIRGITRFLDTGLHRRFGLPETLSSSGTDRRGVADLLR